MEYKVVHRVERELHEVSLRETRVESGGFVSVMGFFQTLQPSFFNRRWVLVCYNWMSMPFAK